MKKISRILAIGSVFAAIRIAWLWIIGSERRGQGGCALFPVVRSGPRKTLPLSEPACLVCQGGGAQGAWQAGVISRLLEEGISFKSSHGTSAGALNAAMAFSGKTGDDFKRIWCDTPWNKIWRWSAIANIRDGAVASSEPLRRLIASELSSEALRRGGGVCKKFCVNGSITYLT